MQISCIAHYNPLGGSLIGVASFSCFSALWLKNGRCKTLQKNWEQANNYAMQPIILKIYDPKRSAKMREASMAASKLPVLIL